MYEKDQVVETTEKLESSKSIVLDDGVVLHDVHRIEGTAIIVHKETEEEVHARRYGNADQVTWKT
jgi:DNA-binding cell septation regulator SpoVG